MPKPGYKACRSCLCEVPVACKQCSHCNAKFVDSKRCSVAVVSPVHGNSFTRFKHAALASPIRQRANRNQTARLPSNTPREAGNTGTVADGARQEESSSQHHDPDDAPESSAVSPIVPARITAADRDVLGSYVNQLRIDGSRCMVVAESEEGAVCYAVAGLAVGHDNSVSIVVGPLKDALHSLQMCDCMHALTSAAIDCAGKSLRTCARPSYDASE